MGREARKPPGEMTRKEREAFIEELRLSHIERLTAPPEEPESLGSLGGRGLAQGLQQAVGGRTTADPTSDFAEGAASAGDALLPAKPGPDAFSTALEIGGSMLGGSAGGRAAGLLSRGRAPLARLLADRSARIPGAIAGGVATTPITGRDPGDVALESGIGELAGTALEPVIIPASRLVARGISKLVPEPMTGARAALAQLAHEPEGLGRFFSVPEESLLSAGQVTGSRGLQRLEALTESSFGGAGPVRGARDRATQRAVDDFEGFARGVTEMDELEAGEIIQNMLEGKSLSFRQAAGAKYAAVDAATDGAVVDFTGVKAAAARLKEQIKVKGGGASSVVDSILAEADEISFADAAHYRSDLLAVVDGPQELVRGKAKGISQVLATVTDREMARAATELSPEALKAWRVAGKFWKSGAEDFNHKSVLALVRADPERVVANLVPASGKVRSSTIARLRKIAGGDQKAQEAIRGAVLGRMMHRASDTSAVVKAIDPTSTSPSLFGEKLLKQLGDLGARGQEELFGKEMGEKLIRHANAIATGQRGLDVSGGLSTALVQSGGLLTLSGAIVATDQTVGTGDIATAAAIIFGPRAVGRMLADGQLVRLLARAPSLTPGTKVFQHVTGQILARVDAMRRVLGTGEVSMPGEQLTTPESPLTRPANVPRPSTGLGPVTLTDEQRQEIQ